MTRRLAHLVLPLLACAVAACAAGYDRTDITAVSQPEQGGVVTFTQIRVTQGTLLTASVVPYNDDDKPIPGTVESEDPSVLETTRALDGRWAFIGRKRGVTRVRLLAKGDVTHVIPAQVVEPVEP